MFGMACEITFGGKRAVFAHRRKSRRISNRPMIALIPGINRGEQRRYARSITGDEEHPTPLLAPRGNARIAKDFDMA